MDSRRSVGDAFRGVDGARSSQENRFKLLSEDGSGLEVGEININSGYQMGLINILILLVIIMQFVTTYYTFKLNSSVKGVSNVGI